MLKPYLTILTLSLLISACFGGGGGSPAVSQSKTVTISWQANNETLVNSSGGGYRVYYSTQNGFDINNSAVQVIDVPYSSGSQAPTSTSFTLTSGTYYVKIVAYSQFDGSETSSSPSQQLTVVVPFA